jgi:hypothetical protein
MSAAGQWPPDDGRLTITSGAEGSDSGCSGSGLSADLVTVDDVGLAFEGALPRRCPGRHLDLLDLRLAAHPVARVCGPVEPEILCRVLAGLRRLPDPTQIRE